MTVLQRPEGNVEVSVIIASYNSKCTIERCLRSLECQRTSGEFEVIVIDSSTDGTSELVARRFPGVRLFAFTERRFPGDARNIGVSKSTGTIIAFTDADCFVDENWIQNIVAAHRENPQPVIGGAVDNGNPESYVGWAYYLSEFSQWIPQTTATSMVDIPTTCLTVKRWAFEKYGPFLEGTYCSDTAFNWRAVRGGYIPLFIPSITVWHINVTDLRNFLRRRLFHGRCFGRVRQVEQGLSSINRLAHILSTPFLPFLLFYRRALYVVGKQTYVKEFILSAPLVFAGLAAWSWGEMLGYWENGTKR